MVLVSWGCGTFGTSDADLVNVGETEFDLHTNLQTAIAYDSRRRGVQAIEFSIILYSSLASHSTEIISSLFMQRHQENTLCRTSYWALYTASKSLK